MRLAVVETLPRGGLLHYAVQLADALAERGHDVDVIGTRGNELAEHRGAARMRPILASSDLPPARPGFLPRHARRAAIGWRLAAGWSRILLEARRGRYDAVIVDNVLDVAPTAAGALLLTALPGRPTIAHVCHNARPFNRWSGEDLFASSPLLTALLRRLYPRFDLVWLHGERSLQDFEASWPAARTELIPHGDERIFGDEPPAPATEPRILFFGDWRRVKGLSVLMEAFDLLAGRRPDARLTIAGKPSPETDADAVREWVRGHGDRVTLDDRYVPNEEVPGIFASARVVAIPYLAGYQSGVTHLALTMARPVVASDVGDLASVVVDGRTGRLVPPGDPAALASALEEVAFDPELAERLGTEGRRHLLDRASWPKVAATVEEHLGAVAR
ncbi:MAG TPA: glycosyltransferase family 4 protein [Solirubrobacteraceae bacterium]|nr:glycosyltransferase family 4 protein [Solirubrobacteraceae bacterium]